LAVAAVVAVIGVAGIAVAVGTSFDDDETASPGAATTVAPVTEAPPGAAPVEFTACIEAGPDVHTGTDKRVDVPLPDGEMTVLQSRGFTYRQSLTSVSDPRLEGTLYSAWDQDQYILPGAAEWTIATFTDRIENDEGAWQGSVVMLSVPDETSSVQMVMVGEGAYEGLTAIVAREDFWGGGCAVRGYIIDGGIPAPPVPRTGQ
jgi:hypothetical protein